MIVIMGARGTESDVDRVWSTSARGGSRAS